MQALAERSPDTNAHRQDEPYRRASPASTPPGRHAEARADRRRSRTPCRGARKTLTASAAEFGRPAHHHARWRHHGAALVGTQRLRPLLRAVRGVRLSPGHGGPAQSSDKHEEVVAELLATARIEAALRQLTKTPSALLLGLLNDAARCACMASVYSTRPGRTGHLRGPRVRMRQRYGAQAIRHYIISHTETVSDLLEVLLLQRKSAWRCAARRCQASGRASAT